MPLSSDAQRKFRSISLALVFGALLSGCAGLPEFLRFSSSNELDKDEYSDWNAERFFTEAKKELSEKRYEKAARLYEKLEARYPFGQYATQAQLDIAYAYYKNDEPDSAIAAADRFIKLNPTHSSVDYAHYLKGLVNYNRGIGFLDRFLPTDSSQRDPGSAKDAYKDFEELVNRYPNSRYADDARQRIMSLRNNLAMYEVHVADFYMRRGAYMAAAQRCAEVIKHYQRTQAVPTALRTLEQAYRQLEMNDLADDAARVYTANYGEGKSGLTEDMLYQPSFAEKVWDFIGLEN